VSFLFRKFPPPSFSPIRVFSSLSDANTRCYERSMIIMAPTPKSPMSLRAAKHRIRCHAPALMYLRQKTSSSVHGRAWSGSYSMTTSQIWRITRGGDRCRSERVHKNKTPLVRIQSKAPSPAHRQRRMGQNLHGPPQRMGGRGAMPSALHRGPFSIRWSTPPGGGAAALRATESASASTSTFMGASPMRISFTPPYGFSVLSTATAEGPY
jgi:hypothetical protein